MLIFLILNTCMGCFSYQALEINDKQKIKVEGKVKITTSEDDVHYLYDVEIEGGTVTGKEKTETNKIRELVLAVDEIKKMEQEEFQTGLTILVLMAIPVAILPLLLLQMEK